MSGFSVVIRDLSYYPSVLSRKPVLDGVNLHINGGEFVAIVGLNGAGKSSLLRAISGEIAPTKGEVTVGGQRVSQPINRIIDRVGVVHQFDSPDLIDHLTVGQNIAIRQLLGGGHPNYVFATGGRWSREIATRLASEAKLQDYDLNELVLNLNGGRRQVLSVAIAIHFEHCENPCQLLLLDEHTSRLDHQNATSVMQYTADQAKAANATVVMVTHRYSDAMRFATRLLIMRDGRICVDMQSKDVDSVEDLVTKIEGSTV